MISFNSPFPSAEIQQVLYLTSASVSFPHFQRSILKLCEPPGGVNQTLTHQAGRFLLDRGQKVFYNNHKSRKSSFSQRSNVALDVQFVFKY